MWAFGHGQRELAARHFDREVHVNINKKIEKIHVREIEDQFHELHRKDNFVRITHRGISSLTTTLTNKLKYLKFDPNQAYDHSLT